MLLKRDGVDSWPGADQRAPSRSQANWSIRAPLARWLAEAGAHAAGSRVLDVGCGHKPYYPFFASAAEYVGVDLEDNPSADLHGSIEQLPFADGVFDVVLCIQMLEHVADPYRAVRELHRVTRPGGVVLLSTHGTQVYHPRPEDYWRWTGAGLERLFELNGPWRSIEIAAGAGTAACLGMLVSTYLDLALTRVHAASAGKLLVRSVNALAAGIDARSSKLRQPVAGSLIANFHVVAER